MARKGYPAEFRRRALDLVAAGEPVREVARLPGVQRPVHESGGASRKPI
jgi:hypothetical protein